MSSIIFPPPSQATKADPPVLDFYPHGAGFAASCPPDVSPRTRIVAVCGITNFGDLASPAEDGWFLSDFWMFNHLLRRAPVRNQIWLTCCDPKLLFGRYGQYSHEAAGTLRVVEPKALLERFVSTVEGECKLAVEAEETVLLLIFGHWNIESFGVALGSHSNPEFDAEKAPKLTFRTLRRAIAKKAECTLLTTSTFSGGWAMYPDLNRAVAYSGKASQLWNATTRYTRGCSGSVSSSEILDAILATHIKDEANLGKPGIDYEELRETECYVEMKCLISDHFKQSDRFHAEHMISFAAQDDGWTEASRAGVPLTFFQERWEELTALPAQKDDVSNRDPTYTFEASAEDSRAGSTSRRAPSMSRYQIFTIARTLAAAYVQSLPGPDNLSINIVLHGHVRRLLSGKTHYEGKIDSLIKLGYTLGYRLDVIKMATHYKDLLGLSYPDCGCFSIEAWTYPLYESNDAIAKEKLKRYNCLFNLISKARIISLPSEGQGYAYLKPQRYLAIALVDSGKTNQEVEEAIITLKNVHTASLAAKVESVRGAGWFGEQAEQLLKPVQKTLRPLPPM